MVLITGYLQFRFVQSIATSTRSRFDELHERVGRLLGQRAVRASGHVRFTFLMST